MRVPKVAGCSPVGTALVELGAEAKSGERAGR